jgi:Zn-dependent protease
MNGIDFAAIVSGISVGAIPLLLAITLHEAGHALAASRCGDQTAAMLGRLSLNPIRHIDPTGTILVPLGLWIISGGNFLFGWAKPVPINPRNLRNYRRDMMWVAAAGPCANFLMAFAWALLLSAVAGSSLEPTTSGQWLLANAQNGILFNILLAIFNLIPIPPLDGGRVLRSVVGQQAGQVLDRIEPFGLIIIIGLLWSGLLWVVLVPIFLKVEQLILFLAQI